MVGQGYSCMFDKIYLLLVFGYTHHNKHRERGLVSLAKLSLKEARELARHYSDILKKGNDPIVSRDTNHLKTSKVISFKKFAQAAFESKKAELNVKVKMIVSFLHEICTLFHA